MPSIKISISLPENMLDRLKLRKLQEGIPVSTQIQRIIDADITIEHHAIQLLAQLYIMCDVAADFSNGVTHNGIDEGQVLAGRS